MQRLALYVVLSCLMTFVAGCSGEPVHTPHQLIQAIKSGDSIELTTVDTHVPKVVLSSKQRERLQVELSAANLKPIRMYYKIPVTAQMIVRDRGKDIAYLSVYEGGVISFSPVDEGGEIISDQEYFQMKSNPIPELVAEHRQSQSSEDVDQDPKERLAD